MNAAKDIARAPTSVVVVPAEKFFTRIVPLSPSEEVAAQVMLAVESLAPLPLGQLYYGYRVADDLRSAETSATQNAKLFRLDLKTLIGGGGNDTYVLDNVGDTIQGEYGATICQLIRSPASSAFVKTTQGISW